MKSIRTLLDLPMNGHPRLMVSPSLYFLKVFLLNPSVPSICINKSLDERMNLNELLKSAYTSIPISQYRSGQWTEVTICARQLGIRLLLLFFLLVSYLKKW